MWLNLWPACNLTGIRKQHADDSTFFSSFLDREQSLTRNPTILQTLLVGLTLTLSDDDVETIIAKVTSLTRTLDTITDNCDSFVLQYFTCFLQ